MKKKIMVILICIILISIFVIVYRELDNSLGKKLVDPNELQNLIRSEEN